MSAKRLRLQFVCVHGCPHELIGDPEPIFQFAAEVMAEGNATCVVIEDHAAAIEEAMDDLEDQVRRLPVMVFYPKGG